MDFLIFITLLSWVVVIGLGTKFRIVRDKNTDFWATSSGIVLYLTCCCGLPMNPLPNVVKNFAKVVNDYTKGFLALFLSLLCCTALVFYFQWAIWSGIYIPCFSCAMGGLNALSLFLDHPLVCPSVTLKSLPGLMTTIKVPRDPEEATREILFRWTCFASVETFRMGYFAGDEAAFNVIHRNYSFTPSTDELDFLIPTNYTSFVFARDCFSFSWRCQVHVYPEKEQKRGAALPPDESAEHRTKSNRPPPSPFLIFISLLLMLVALVVLIIFCFWILALGALIVCCTGIFSLLKSLYVS